MEGGIGDPAVYAGSLQQRESSRRLREYHNDQKRVASRSYHMHRELSMHQPDSPRTSATANGPASFQGENSREYNGLADQDPSSLELIRAHLGWTLQITRRSAGCRTRSCKTGFSIYKNNANRPGPRPVCWHEGYNAGLIRRTERRGRQRSCRTARVFSRSARRRCNCSI